MHMKRITFRKKKGISTVLKKVGGGWNNLIGPEFTINVPSASGNPVVYIVVDGTY